MRQKKRQERVKEGQSSGGISQLKEMMTSIKGDEVRSKRKRRQVRQCGFPRRKGISKQKMHKRSLKDDLQRSKRSLKITRLYEDEVFKLKTLKTRRMVRDSFISSLEETFLEN
ncbi:hypothetical protein M9H77_04381 [Catharanthus roseus]|uniref:Uncharacterized protein n=1 Tax=Catharanthus roseus TaxID=4058 RepID=A0ACC0CDU9_CATRO|nr:hypothetical protein M9H77_04381 [Catharanthus roseus]